MIALLKARLTCVIQPTLQNEVDCVHQVSATIIHMLHTSHEYIHKSSNCKQKGNIDFMISNINNYALHMEVKNLFAP